MKKISNFMVTIIRKLGPWGIVPAYSKKSLKEKIKFEKNKLISEKLKKLSTEYSDFLKSKYKISQALLTQVLENYRNQKASSTMELSNQICQEYQQSTRQTEMKQNKAHDRVQEVLADAFSPLLQKQSDNVTLKTTIKKIFKNGIPKDASAYTTLISLLDLGTYQTSDVAKYINAFVQSAFNTMMRKQSPLLEQCMADLNPYIIAAWQEALNDERYKQYFNANNIKMMRLVGELIATKAVDSFSSSKRNISLPWKIQIDSIQASHYFITDTSTKPSTVSDISVVDIDTFVIKILYGIYLDTTSSNLKNQDQNTSTEAITEAINAEINKTFTQLTQYPNVSLIKTAAIK